jgi:hypothetical protein
MQRIELVGAVSCRSPIPPYAGFMESILWNGGSRSSIRTPNPPPPDCRGIARMPANSFRLVTAGARRCDDMREKPAG